MELELKFRAKKDYRSQLDELGFIHKRHKHLIDTYYLSDEKIDEVRTWLRLREDKLQKTCSFDFHQYISQYATEETEIELLPQDAEKLKKIISKLGLSIKCVVDKERHTYVKDNIEIALDTVMELGEFIEIEIEGDNNSENISKIDSLANIFGLNPKECEKNGYPDLLIRK